LRVVVELWSVDDKASLYLNGALVVAASWGFSDDGYVGEVPGGAGPVDVSAYARRGTNSLRFVVENNYPSGAAGFFSVKVNGVEVRSDGYRSDYASLGTVIDRSYTFSIP
jgi:hypothetical protein